MNAVAGERRAAAALLIDADNISDTANIERAMGYLQDQGWRLTVRRAYGGHEKLSGLRDCLLRHGIRALVNQGKGTTDALLIVDVMDLFHTAELPNIVALASSDADFAPLAVRLREAGIKVICFAQWGKAASEELAKVYEEVVYLDRVAEPPRPERRAAPRAAPRPAPEPAPKPARKAAAKKAPPAKAAEPADEVWEALAALPGFEDGDSLEMNEVVKRLRDAKLLGRSASGPRFLAKNAPWLELIPPSQPNKVRLKSRGR